MFVEYLCKRSPKIKTKNIKNYSSILAFVNHRNWLDDSPPLNEYHSKGKINGGVVNLHHTEPVPNVLCSESVSVHSNS